MALLKMILKKIVKNRVFILFLMVGLLISSALLSAIPMYTNGSLGKLLTKELEKSQQTDQKYPGSLLIYYTASDSDITKAIKDMGDSDKSIFTDSKVTDLFNKRLNTFSELDQYMKKDLLPKINIKSLASYANYILDPRTLTHENYKQGDTREADSCTVESFTDINSHIKLVDGRMPQKNSDGIYEVMVSETALANLKITLNTVYILGDFRGHAFEDIKVKPVASFTIKDSKDVYWSYINTDFLSDCMILDQDTMIKDFIEKKPTQISSAYWYYALDYHSINMNNLGGFLSGINTVNSDVVKITSETGMDFSSKKYISSYYDKNKQLTNMMWSLNVPVIVLLCLYMFMISGLIIEKERNEISQLASRGASKLQVVTGYLIEGLLLGLVATVLSPIIGFFICRILGSSSGFMEFVNRKAMIINIEFISYAYVLLAVLVFIVTLLVPAYRATKTSILEHKRNVSRKNDSALWEKFFFDVILLAIAAYGYFSFSQRQDVLIKTGASAAEVSIDPLLFFVPVIFIFGISLLFLRIYPLLISLIYWLGKKVWGSSIYIALTQVGRSIRSYDFLMVFLILTISVGTFSANSARTISQNQVDKIYYKNGADIVTQEFWKQDELGADSSADTPDGVTPPATGTTTPAADNAFLQVTKTLYYEPDFTRYTKVEGIKKAAKVLIKNETTLSFERTNVSNVEMMAIEPYEFGQVEWYSNGLLKHHINEYLNLMTSEPSSCLISQSVSTTYNIKVGDSITVSNTGASPVILNVYGIVDYWPSWNPNKDASSPASSKVKAPMLVVANLGFIQSQIGIEPYQVWMKMNPDATSKQVYDSLNKLQIYPTFLNDARQQAITLKNDPYQLSINGSLTMGFIISGVICLMGFILYWVLSLRARILQFGVLRAIGVSKRQLRMIIIWEQLFTSGAAIVMGVFIGFVSSTLFIPFFQMSFSSSSQVPPFKVVSYTSDLIKVYIFIGITILIGIGVLIYLLQKIKISNVIKLGED